MYGVTWTELGVFHEVDYNNLETAKIFAERLSINCVIDADSLYILDDDDNIICAY